MFSAFPDAFSAAAAFAVPAALVTVAPGADTALVLRAALLGGGRSAAATAAGVAAGLVAWGTASALGAAALLASLPAAYLALRVGGAAYLLLLGARMVWTALRAPRGPAASGGDGPGAADGRGGFVRGLATNLLNPKIGVFYLALLPQFAVDGVAPAVLGGALALVHAAMALGWLGILGAAAGRARRVLARPGAVRGVEAVTGSALVVMGAALAATAP
ncbi:LysE family translocator [Nocardiopsis suaedae]|uniref:LysE family transporter n=1 Tax=Nocardiopsis suaedae TaxID=3018444 RepID=A0ABT4TKJ7_9ACTN|nr:LysE family transporter [Nocardiopsis suaedae]MDA2804627.1 LysE family transporter [Nocardiopsis suaedae]